MKTYHKIQTVFKRDPDNNFKTLLEGEFSLPEFEYLSENTWEFTEKIDGTNIRVILNGDIRVIDIRGKTDKAEIPPFLLTALEETFYPLKDTFQEIFGDTPVCMYGEGYGLRIQKGGGNYRKDNGFVLFDIKIGHYWLQRKDVEGIAKRLGLDIVPIIGEGTLQDMIDVVKAGFDSQWGDFSAEGIVARPKVELVSRNGDRIVVKLKHKDF